MRYENVIFDLDGTLLDTIVDISHAINDALRDFGFPWRYDRESTTKVIGNGADALIHRVLQKEDKPEVFDKFKPVYLGYYKAYQGILTKPFDGMTETLQTLIKTGVKLYVCTNKPDHLSQIILKQCLPDVTFEAIHGHQEGEPVKPDRFVITRFENEHGVDLSKSLFVGDSLPDYETAMNAGLPVCMCLWGYGNYQDDFMNKCSYVIHEPQELLNIVL